MQTRLIALAQLAAAAAFLAAPMAAATAAPAPPDAARDAAAAAPDTAATATPNTVTTPGTPAASSALPTEGPLSHDEIRQAVERLAGDSNLAGVQKSRALRWRQSQPPPANTPSWLGGLAAFLAQWMSFLLRVAGAVGAALAAIGLIRWLRTLPSAAEPSAAARARRVGGLDIDPDSLPKDIGAAALTLLEAQRTREALSLLYRGALSRAVHRYGVVIRESYTEGEALQAVKASLDPDRAAYLADLIGIRWRTVYAGGTAAPETLRRLCHDFAPALDGAAP
jgi:hypothetical protein